MKKRLFAVLLTAILVLSSLSAFTYAEPWIENKLNSSHQNVYAANDFSGIDSFILVNPLGLAVDVNNPYLDFSFWHFVDTSRLSDHATIYFLKPDGSTYPVTTSENVAGQHYAIITPSDWMLLDGTSYSGAAGNFVLSHSGRHQATMGSLKVQASAAPFYYEIQPRTFYERPIYEFYERDVWDVYNLPITQYFVRTVDKYYERDVFDFYQRDVWNYYERDVDEYFERPVWDIYQREAQRYLIPVFTRKINSVDGTLVTRLEYSDNTTKAVPTNGGIFKNGHTYVEVNVAEASQPGGIWYTIADSSRNNGKKTPNEYNRPILYEYNVQIIDGQLIISFPDTLAYVNVGAEIVNKAKDFSGNAPKHYAGGLSVPLPAGYGDTVLLYTHIDGLGWYERDENGDWVYRFLEWRYDNDLTVYGEYQKIDSAVGEDVLVDTIKGDWELMKSEPQEYELVDTDKGPYVLVDTIYGDYTFDYEVVGEKEFVRRHEDPYVLVNSIAGDYEIVLEDTVRTLKAGTFSSSLVLTVNGVTYPLDTSFGLPIGSYTFTISSTGNEFAPVSKTVNVGPGDNGTIVFDPISWQQADVVLPVQEFHDDGEAIEDYKDNVLADEINDFYLPEVKTDLPAVEHHKDREPINDYKDRAETRFETDRDATRHDKDVAGEDVYIEEYKYLPDIKLGNDYDAWNEWAIRID